VNLVEHRSNIGSAADVQGALPLSKELQVHEMSAPFPVNLRCLLIIGFAALVLALPMLINGPMEQGHDTYEHLNYSSHFSEQFWSGEWYPRWLVGMNHGLGTPTLFVYPPLPSYVYTLLVPVGRVLHYDAFRMGEALALFGSGVCAFLWLNTIAGEAIALASAVLYMLMPYHLAIDFYRRTALSECWALVWIPLVLYCCVKAMERPVFVVGIAFAYALLILSHLVSVFIFSLIPLAVIFASSPRGEKLKSILRVAAGMLLGGGLSCFYFVSAFSHAKYFPVSRLPLWSDLEGHLLTVGKLVHGSSGGFMRLMSMTALDMTAVCVMCGIVVLAKGRPESRRIVLFWLMVFIVPLLLMHGRAAAIWKACPPLFAAIQYPWRLNIVLCIAALPIIAVFLSEISRLPRLSRALLLVLLFVLISPWLLSYTSVWRSYRAQTARRFSLVNDDDGWFSAWSAPGTDEASALQASMGPQVRFLAGTGTADVRLWKPRHIEIQTNSATGGSIVINQFYYAPWRAALVDNSKSIDVKATLPEGLMEVQVPPGSKRVRLDIPTGSAEHIGRWISGVCVFLSAVLTWSLRRDGIPVSAVRSNSRVSAAF